MKLTLAILLTALTLDLPTLAADQPGGTLGRVVGRVSVAGSIAKPPPLQVYKSRSFCGATVPNETLMISAGGGLRNAAALLHALDRRATVPPPRQAVLDNQHCAFVPHVQIVSTGSELVLKNSDPILHTVHARLGRETLFNVGLPRWRQVIKRMNRSGIVKVDCDVLHTWMSAVVVVTDSPYTALSDEQGEFTIDNLPAGTYDLSVWHERLGQQSARLTVREGVSTEIEIIYTATEKPLPIHSR